MAKYTSDTLTADGRSTAFNLYNGPRGDGDSTEYTAYVQGTFDSGTATLQTSTDGTNWVDVLDQSGAAVTFTANKSVNFTHKSAAEDPAKVSVNLAGATSPSLNFILYDSK